MEFMLLVYYFNGGCDKGRKGEQKGINTVIWGAAGEQCHNTTQCSGERTRIMQCQKFRGRIIVVGRGEVGVARRLRRNRGGGEKIGARGEEGDLSIGS